MKKYNYEKLEIYQEAHVFVVKTYKLTAKFPKSEQFGLISQLRRAATSIVLNIVEGSSRSSKKEFKVYIERSIGSALEVRAALEICKDLGYLTQSALDLLNKDLDSKFFKLQKFKQYLTR